jgi:tetratricopeptide (TPR) repeat protein
VQSKQPRQAEPLCRQALELFESLAAEFPEHAPYRRDLADAHNQLAIILKRTGRYPDAESAYRKAIAVLSKLVAADPSDDERRLRLGTTSRNLGILLREMKQPKEALTAYEQAQIIYDQLAREFPAYPFHRSELAEIAEGQARTLVQLGQGEKALALIESAVEQQKLALRPNPEHPMYRERLRNHYFHLAELLIDRGDHDRGGKAVLQLIVLGDRPVDTFVAAGLLARCSQLAENDQLLSAEKRQESARAYGDKAVGLLRTAVETGKLRVSDVKDDPTMIPLTKRQDFQTLMATQKQP